MTTNQAAASSSLAERAMFNLKNKEESHGPFDTKDDLLDFWSTELKMDDSFWIEDTSKIKKISKKDQNES